MALTLSEGPIPALPDFALSEFPTSGTRYGHCRNMGERHTRRRIGACFLSTRQLQFAS